MPNRSHLLPCAIIYRYIYYPRWFLPLDQVIVVSHLEIIQSTTLTVLSERSAKNYGTNTWPMGIAVRSHIFALSPFQSRASETVKICASLDRKSICELCRARMTRTNEFHVDEEKKTSPCPFSEGGPIVNGYARFRLMCEKKKTNVPCLSHAKIGRGNIYL